MPTKEPDGFLAAPEGDSKKGVLVLHPWWGLNDTIRNFCKRLADAGFTVFASDLYHGKIARTIPEAEALGSALNDDPEPAKKDVVRAAAFLKDKTGGAKNGMAVIGFSLGATYAVYLASEVPDLIHSVVLYYGCAAADFEKSKSTYLGHFAENDEYEPRENRDWLQRELREAGREITLHVYPDTEHWFCEPDREQYNEEAAELAWKRTLEFLNR